MTHWVTPLISFIIGGAFGVLTMCLMFVAKKSDRWYENRMEVRTDAGRSGEQNDQPCDQHIKADSQEHRDSGPDVPEAQIGR